MIAEGEESAFEEGMVIAVEVWVVDWTGTRLKAPELSQIIPQVFGNEDYVVVTKDGCDRLTSVRKDIRSLPFAGSSASLQLGTGAGDRPRRRGPCSSELQQRQGELLGDHP